MTRSYQYSSNSPIKTSLKKSSPCDFQYPKKSQLEYEFTIPSSPASVSCLNSLFTDLCVTRSGRKNTFGRFHLSSKSRRCAHLASLIEQCSSPSSSSQKSPGKRLNQQGKQRKALFTLTNTQDGLSLRSSSSTSCGTTSSSESVPQTNSFPFNVRPIELDTAVSAWGHFVEAEDEHPIEKMDQPL